MGQVVPCLFPLALPSWLYNVVAFTRISMQSAMVPTSGHVPAYDLVLLFFLSACSAFLSPLPPCCYALSVLRLALRTLRLLGQAWARVWRLLVWVGGLVVSFG